MSWNLARTINNLAFEVGNIQADVTTLEQKTSDISDVTNTGTVFSKNVYAEKFIVPNGTNKQYLMADGTLLEESSNQQSNIYLYSFSQTLIEPPGTSQVRFNTNLSTTTSELYINHVTRDNVDIHVWLELINQTSVVYLQDQNSSEDWVRFDVTAPIINNTNYVTVPCAFQSALGDGLTRFAAGHNIILSIFTNNLEVDLRLSALEQKTYHISATSTATNINKNVNIGLDFSDQFNINDASGMVNYFQVSNDGAILSRDLNMDGKPINNVAYPLNSSDVSSKSYVDNMLESYTPLADFNDLSSVVSTNSNDIDVLQGQTQNQTATNTETTFNKALRITLDDTGGTFSVRDATLNQLMTVNPTTINVYKPINLNSQNISGANTITTSGNITASSFIKSSGSFGFLKSDGTTDTATYFTTSDGTTLQTKTQNQTATNSLTTFTSGVLFSLNTLTGQSFTIRDTGGNLLYLMSDTVFFLNRQMNANTQNIINANNISCQTITSAGDITGNKFIVPLAGSNSFLKGNGDLDISTYVKADGTVSMTGALNMGTNNIFNAGILSGNSILLGGSSTDFLMANGSSNSTMYMPTDDAYSVQTIPYINSSGQLTSSLANRYCDTSDSLQSIIDTMSSGFNYNIQLSAGVHAVTNLVIDKTSYSINGVTCPDGQATTMINGLVILGRVGVITSLIKISNVVFNNNFSFLSSPTAQYSNHSFSNCTFNTDINFPSSVNGTTGYLYFYDCTFKQSSVILFNNISLSIVFVRCVFNNQVITNNSPAGSVVFDTCRGLISLAIPNATLRGVNVLFSGVSQLTAGSLSLSGPSTSFVMGNGGLNSQIYPTISTLNGNFVFNGVNCPFQARRVFDGTTGIVSIFLGGFLATVATTGSTFISNSVLPVGWRPFNAVFNPGRIRKLNNISIGTIILYASGELGLTDASQSNNYWIAGNTNSGIATDCSFTYPV